MKPKDQHPTRQRAFTLVELLVVLAIIVILVALMIGGLDHAIKSSNRASCATRQRSLAQAAIMYALENERLFPSPAGPSGLLPSSSLVILNVSTTDGPAEYTGLGYLVGSGRIAAKDSTGEAMHCPSLDTTSATPANVGMDAAASHSGVGAAKGASFWTSSPRFEVVSGYYYRGLSYYRANNKAVIHSIIAKANFVLTSDLVTYVPGGDQYGRDFHHRSGWNASFGDGHVAYVEDPEPFVPADTLAEVRGYVEREVAQGKKIFGGQDQTEPGADPNADAANDERVFTYLGSGTIAE